MKILVTRHGQTDWNLQGKAQGRKDIELNSNFIVYAHRGASAYAPENTKSSFLEAIELKVLGIE